MPDAMLDAALGIDRTGCPVTEAKHLFWPVTRQELTAAVKAMHLELRARRRKQKRDAARGRDA